jgi:hypothetical protein
MYKNKIIFSVATVPVIVFMQQLSQFQRRARDDKLFEIERRQTQLKKDKSVDITPPNGGSFPWS